MGYTIVNQTLDGSEHAVDIEATVDELTFYSTAADAKVAFSSGGSYLTIKTGLTPFKLPIRPASAIKIYVDGASGMLQIVKRNGTSQ